jgi:hypothetical protein
MPVQLFIDEIEPADPGAPVSRFLDMRKFEDLFKKEMALTSDGLAPITAFSSTFWYSCVE